MGNRKEFQGVVHSDKMQKTIIVRVMRMSKHPKYKRIIKGFNKFKVHDEKNEAKLGDLVRIQETRPLSKDKRFKLIGIVKKSASAHIQVKEEVK